MRFEDLRPHVVFMIVNPRKNQLHPGDKEDNLFIKLEHNEARRWENANARAPRSDREYEFSPSQEIEIVTAQG